MQLQVGFKKLLKSQQEHSYHAGRIASLDPFCSGFRVQRCVTCMNCVLEAIAAPGRKGCKEVFRKCSRNMLQHFKWFLH